MAAHPHWVLPDDAPITLIETEEQLEQHSGLFETALCCGIDAEWPPEETTAEAAHTGGGPPHATLVQLALWLPPEPGGGGGGTCALLLLDMQALPRAVAKATLQRLFRCRTCLKLGFGLVHDLRAIATALGPEGGSCIAVVEPACDLGSVHRFLRHRRAAGVHKAVDLGLSGLVQVQLGRPLDKALQCSAWGRRPLSAAQQRYAAADAACLLALLGSLIGAVGQPEEWPMAEAEAEAPADGPAAGQASAAEGGAADSEAATAADGSSSSGSRSGGGAEAPESKARGAQPPQQQQQLAQALLGGCSLRQIEAAAAAWGVRLEISGSRAVKRGRRRGARARQQQRRTSGQPEPAAAGTLPRHVPWLNGDKQLTGEPRFLCDVMAEGLAHQLRLAGVDCESLQHSMEKAPRHQVWRRMCEQAEEEGRVVLTRDRTFISGGYSDQAMMVHCDGKREQLVEVLTAFGLLIQTDDLLSRCARCNGEFLEEPMPAALLPEGHGVAPGILAQHDEFWVCARCSGVYWQGSQYSRAMQQMTALASQLSLA